jgi:hypothetical protein
MKGACEAGVSVLRGFAGRAVLMGLTNNEPAPWLEIDVIVLSFACLIMVSSNFNSLFSL